MSYSIVERGSQYALNYKAYFAGHNGFVSPMHDIPLHANNDILNMVVEIPRWTNAKMEMCKEEKLNPIKQDTQKGRPRYIANCFPHHGYIWNYGALPQTWEDPNHVDEHTHLKGDNDPIDVCEIGSKIHNRGDVVQVKVLGIMALIDEGETDWKVIAIDINDPMAKEFDDIDDVEKHMPGLLQATTEWFTIYKVPTGKPPNQFAFDGEAKDKAFALEVIKESHEEWKKLIQKSQADASMKIINTTQTASSARVTQEAAKAIVEAADQFGNPAPIPEEVNKWHYVRL